MVGMISRWLPLSAKPDAVIRSYVQDCFLRDSCQLDAGDARILLFIVPESLPVLQDLDISLELENINANHVTMEFSGRDMPMALMPFELRKQGFDGLKQRYSGKGSIAFCATDPEMVWQARLVIATPSGNWSVVFELHPESGMTQGISAMRLTPENVF